MKRQELAGKVAVVTGASSGVGRAIARALGAQGAKVGLIWIGWSTVRALLAQRLVPGLLDRYAAKNAWDSQTTLHLPPGHPAEHHRDNLDLPIPGDRGAHGPFDARSRNLSLQPWLRRNVTPLALVALGLGFLLRAAWRRA